MTLAPVKPKLSPGELAEAYREAMRDKSYQLTPLGAEVAAFMRAKGKRLAEASAVTYESSLDKFARYYADLELKDFEPPHGIRRVEEYLDHHWGNSAPGTYNRNLSITSEFFKWAVARGYMVGNPCVPIEPAKKRQVHREVFTQSRRLFLQATDGSCTLTFKKDELVASEPIRAALSDTLGLREAA